MALSTPIAPGTKHPGFYIRLDLKGSQLGAGGGGLWILMLAPTNAADGDLTPDTEIRQVFGPDEGIVSHGAGGQGHLTLKAIFRRWPNAKVFVGAPTASAGATATETQTITGTANENTVIRTTVSGRIFDTNWANGESDATFRTRRIAQINAATNDCPVIASAGAGAGETDLDAKQAGVWGNDVLISQEILEGGGGLTVDTNPTSLAGGTLEPDYSTILDLAKTTEYTAILPALSNADAALAGATSNGDRTRVHIDTYIEGLDALLQTACIGHTGAIADVKTGAIDRNSEYMWMPYGKNWQSLPCELAGAEVGDALRWASERANYNRIDNDHDGLYGPVDQVADKLTQNQGEDLLNNGVTPLNITPTGDPYLVAPITTHSTESGVPDDRAYHLGDTLAVIIVARDVRAAVKLKFKNVSIAEDLPADAEPYPAGVNERRDVEAFIASRINTIWTRNGVVDRNRFAAAREAGTFAVEINPNDGSEVNFHLPLGIIKPLAKFGATVSKTF